MPVPSDELTWLPIAQRLLSKRDLQQLSLKKVRAVSAQVLTC